MSKKSQSKRNTNLDVTIGNLSKNEKIRNGIKLWTSYFRANPHRFAEEYLGIQLYLYQKIIVYMAFVSDFFMYLGARGQSKSFLVALICCIYAILYPNSKILIASGTRGQSRLIISQKIENELMKMSPNLAREIKDIKTGINEAKVTFHNGSIIEAITSTDNSRGFRCNILILEEFRLIPEDILRKVLRPFLNVNRQPPYLKKPEYSHLIEENKEIYISSAWYKEHWMYDKFKSFVEMMVKGRDYFVCTLPYQLSLEHGLLSKKRVSEMLQESDFNLITWIMEMETLFYGESENAFFKLDDIQRCRSLVKPFYPVDNLNYIENKNKRKKSTKQHGEWRIIGCDVAMMGQKDSDQTVFTCVRLIPNKGEFIKQVVYIESLHGLHSERQAIRLKQLYEDFEADYVIMDTQGNSFSLYEDCVRLLYDTERDVEYPAWTSMNDESMSSRALEENALPVIYSLKVTQLQTNHEISMYLRTCFEKRKIELLVDEIQARDFLENQGFNNKSIEEQAFLTYPYIQTSSLVNELVNLEYEIKNGYVRVKEVGRRRKDRYSSLAYAIYYSKILESQLKEGESDNDFVFTFD